MLSGEAPNWPCIVGIATFTMLVSSTDMNIPTTTTTSGNPHLESAGGGAGAAEEVGGEVGVEVGTVAGLVAGARPGAGRAEPGVDVAGRGVVDGRTGSRSVRLRPARSGSGGAETSLGP